MNRKQKRELNRQNLQSIKIKEKGVAREKLKAFANLAKVSFDFFGTAGIPEEELKLLIDKKSENTDLQKVFTEYHQVKRAEIVLKLMKKNINGSV